MPNTRSPSSWLQHGKKIIARIEDGVLVLLLTVMIGAATAQIVLRNVWDSGLIWGDPLTKVLVLWIGLVGAMVASRQNNHIHIDVLSRFLPARAKAASEALNSLFAAAVCGVLAYHAGRLVLLDKEAATVAFGTVPTWVCELIIPFGFGVIGLRYAVLALSDAVSLMTAKKS